MSLTESNMIQLGTKAPDFTLVDTVSNKKLSLDNAKGKKGTVIVFSCNHCPYVIHINKELVSIANMYAQRGIRFVVISSNNVEKYPMDSPDKMSIVATVLQYPFPYLYDESQEVAKAYEAACTPDIYVYNSDLELYYRGRIDDSRPGNRIPLTGNDLRGALDLMLTDSPSPSKQYPSAGCNIKWK